MSYVLITPVKDEEENLPRLAECVVSQTFLPRIWLIVDDCSGDGTPLVIKRLETDYSWVKGLRLDVPHKRDLDEHFGQTYNLAFRYATRLCEEKGYPINFLVKVDADMIFDDDCVERILVKFVDDERLGVASPHVADIPANIPYGPWKSYRYTISREKDASCDFLSEPSDGLRAYRRRALEDIGGIPETMVPDVVAVAKAKQKGWKAMRLRDIMAFKTRDTGTSIPNGRVLWGLRRYYLDYHPLIVILYVVLEARRGHISKAVAVLRGYIYGAIRRKTKIEDRKVREYFRKTRLKEIVHSIWRRDL